MRIFGIGTDIVKISRFKKLINKKSFLQRLFDSNEINKCKRIKNSANCFAKRFAAKEAFTKALGTGVSRGINFNEITFPFRTKDLIDELIKAFLNSGADTVMPAKSEFAWAWQQTNSNNLVRIDEGDIPRDFKKSLLLGSHGLGCVTHSEIIRQNTLVGERVYLHNIEDKLSFIEVRSQSEADFFYARVQNI